MIAYSIIHRLLTIILSERLQTLEETATKLNLRKIKSFFQEKCAGGYNIGTKNENLKTSSKTSSNIQEVGVTWDVTTSEVKCDATFCVNQSEGVIQGRLKNHLGFNISRMIGGEGQLRNESKSVIGSCVDPGAVWTNGKLLFENLYCEKYFWLFSRACNVH